MSRLKVIGFLLTLSMASLIGACSHDEDYALQPPAPQSTSQLVDQEIAESTNEVIAPLSINELDILDTDTSETTLPRAI